MLTAQHWQEDVAFLVEQLRTSANTNSAVVLNTPIKNAAYSLSQCIPTLAEHQIIVKMNRLLLQCGSGHYHLGLPYNPTIAFQRFPITLEALPNRVFITAATPLYQDLICTEVLQIGDYSIEKVIEIVASLCSDPNLLAADKDMFSHVVIPEILHACGIITTLTKAKLLVRDHTNVPYDVEIEPIPFNHHVNCLDELTFEPILISHPHSQADIAFVLPNSEIAVLKTQQRPTSMPSYRGLNLTQRIRSHTKHDFE